MDRFGLLGLLNVIRMTNPDLNTLALGIDLTTLGLNLNSPEYSVILRYSSLALVAFMLLSYPRSQTVVRDNSSSLNSIYRTVTSIIHLLYLNLRQK